MFETVIGLEVHTQLNTQTKLFCSCATSFDQRANLNTCPVCLALPGALPRFNRSVLHKAVSFGTAVDATINRVSHFDRKSYFYPDSPSAYQITQLYTPIVEHGRLEIEPKDADSKIIRINRAHIEADAGKNIHDDSRSKVDLNRAGTPLLEIVSEPDMRSTEEVTLYLKKLHSIVRYLDISDANMQEGSFRVDVNVSIRPKGDDKLYTRVEIKNINSFKFITKAIEIEVERQIDAWEDGVYDEVIVQETRLFDQAAQVTRSMRGKEDSADYRYFLEPDLLKVVVDDEMYESAIEIPELPDAKRARFIDELGLSPYDASVLTSDLYMANYFESMVEDGAGAKMSCVWLSVELQGRLDSSLEESLVDAPKLALLVKRIEDKTISAKAAKEVLDHLCSSKIGVDEAIDKLGLKQISDSSAIEAIVNDVLSANQDKVEQYRAGKDKLFGFFVGQVMKASKGSANPQSVNEILKREL